MVGANDLLLFLRGLVDHASITAAAVLELLPLVEEAVDAGIEQVVEAIPEWFGEKLEMGGGSKKEKAIVKRFDNDVKKLTGRVQALKAADRRTTAAVRGNRKGSTQRLHSALGPVSAAAPLAYADPGLQTYIQYGSGKSRKYGMGLKLKGRDRVNNFTSGADGEIGVVRFYQYLSPALFTRTRLQRFASMFERFTVNKISFEYVPNVGANTAGSILGYFDYDFLDESEGGVVDIGDRVPITKASSHFGATSTQVWQPCKWDFYKVGNLTDLYTESKLDHFHVPGVFRILTNSAFTADTTLGTLYVSYDIDFHIPQMDEDLAGISASIKGTIGTTDGTHVLVGWNAASKTINQGSASEWTFIDPFNDGASLTIKGLIPDTRYLVTLHMPGYTAITAGNIVGADATTVVEGLCLVSAGATTTATWIAYCHSGNETLSLVPSITAGAYAAGQEMHITVSALSNTGGDFFR